MCLRILVERLSAGDPEIAVNMASCRRYSMRRPALTDVPPDTGLSVATET
jgi:hypothetical protein